MLDNDIATITKKYAITVGLKYWREVIQSKNTNITDRFRAAGLWPLYFTVMQF